jgi:hypothetical protein
MLNIRPTLVRGVILTGLLAGGLRTFTAPVRAADLITYTNVKHGYSIQYPRGWTNVPHSGEDFAFASRDLDAFVTGATATGMTTAQLRKAAVSVLKSNKAKPGTIKVGTTIIHGVTFVTVTGDVPGEGAGEAAQLMEMSLLVQRAKMDYFFGGVWALGRPSTKAQRADIITCLHSITFAHAPR